MIRADGAGDAADAHGWQSDGMDATALRQLLDDVESGRVSPRDAADALSRLPFASAGDALVDHHRALRQGMPEAVYAPGKSAENCVAIVGELLGHGSGPVLLSRADAAQAKAVEAVHGDAEVRSDGPLTTLLWRCPTPWRQSRVLVTSAGTADAAVVDECIVTLRSHGFEPDRLVDIGVAGLHRVLAHLDRITSADAVVVVAGMEGALASVVGGLTSKPVVAVPTSVGYGSGLDGVTAMLAMLSSCASGVTVVGIDNGFGAACAIARLAS